MLGLLFFTVYFLYFYTIVSLTLEFQVMKKLLIFTVLLLAMTACDKEKTFYVADHYAPGGGLLYRENESDEWKTFEGTIRGFEYEEGYLYRVKVKISNHEGKIQYDLVSVENKQKTDYLERKEKLTRALSSKWLVKSIQGGKPTDGEAPYFTIAGDDITGFAGCNKVFGKVSFGLDGDFRVSGLGGTKKLCPGAMAVERAFFKAFGAVRTFELKGGGLLLKDADGTVLVEAEQAPSGTELDGHWVVTAIEGFLNTTGMYPEFTIEGNKISGNTSCNHFSGTLSEVGGGKFVSSGDIMATKKYCPRTMEVEKVFLSALRKATVYTVEKDLIHVFGNEGKPLFTAMLRK